MIILAQWTRTAVGLVLAWLGALQTWAASQRYVGLSLTGRRQRLGIGAGLVLFLLGVTLLALTSLLALAVLIFPALILAVLLLLGLAFLFNRNMTPPLASQPASQEPWTAEPVLFQDAIGPIPGLFLKAKHPNGGTICWVHGVGDNSQTYKWVILRALTRRGFNVLTFDLPGHGVRQDRFSLPAGLETVPAALAYLRGREDVDPDRIGLLGVSLGGMLSIRALAAGDQVQALVLLETPCSLHLTRRLWWKEALSALSFPALDIFRACSPWGLYRTWKPHSVFDPGLEDVLNAIHPEDYISQIYLPKLLVYGGRDPIAPLAHGQFLEQRALQPKTLRIIRAASHITNIFIQETGDLVADWLLVHV